MGRYIKEYQTENDVQTAIDNGELLKPYVAYIESSNTIDWDSKTPDYSKMPLTFNITSDGIISWKLTYSFEIESDKRTIQYSKNGGPVTSIKSSMGGTQFSVQSGDVVKFWGDNADYMSGENSFSGTTAGFTLEGNIMSLINSTNFSGLTSFTKPTPFTKLFWYCTGLTDASNLILPATALTSNCYEQMFEYCSNLTTAPVLPALTLYGSCYSNMFEGCSKLNYIKCLGESNSYWQHTSNWVKNVAASGTFVKRNGTSWQTGNNGIPDGWTVINV